MSAIFSYGEWIDITRRGTSGDQVADILESWKADAYKHLKIEVDQSVEIEYLRERCADLELRLDAYNGNLLDVLQAENERLKAEAAWISVEDRLPEEDGTYLVYYGDSECYGAERALLRPITKSPVFTESVTHWRELPEPPNVTNDAETGDKV